MAETIIKVWRDEEEDLWYWKASSEDEDDVEGFLPDLGVTSTREEVIEAAREAFREETGSEIPDSEIQFKVRGLFSEDEDDSDPEAGLEEEKPPEEPLPERDEDDSEVSLDEVDGPDPQD